MTGSRQLNRNRVAGCIFGILLASLALYACGPGYAMGGRGSTAVAVSASYSELDEWGEWTLSARFGNVWCPSVDAGWAPFTYGNWVWTDRGWLWSSYEPYGWLVFHYGNWYYDAGLGWFWIPGRAWSPATVEWYRYDDYVCWAPRPPAGYRWSQPWEPSRVRPWTVVVQADFMQENVGRHRVTIRPPSNEGRGNVRRGAPEIRTVSTAVKSDITKVKVKRERTTSMQRTFYRTDLPSAEIDKVSRYRAQYRKAPKPRQLTEADDNNREQGRKGEKQRQSGGRGRK